MNERLTLKVKRPNFARNTHSRNCRLNKDGLTIN